MHSESLGVGEGGDQPLRCLFCILGFWVRFPLKQGSVATNLFESHWAGRLGKPFTRADILSPSHRTLGIRVKEWKDPPWAQDSPQPPVGPELLEAEEAEMGASRCC